MYIGSNHKRVLSSSMPTSPPKWRKKHCGERGKAPPSAGKTPISKAMTISKKMVGAGNKMCDHCHDNRQNKLVITQPNSDQTHRHERTIDVLSN